MQHISDHLEIGKRKDCNQIIYNVNEMSLKLKSKIKYDIKDVVTTVIDKIQRLLVYYWFSMDM